MSAADVPSPSPPDTGNSWKASFGYANDNFIIGTNINSLIKARLFPDFDDHVTGSFYFSAHVQEQRTLYLADIYYHIITNRAALFRTDILAVRFSFEEQYHRLRYRAGAGVHLVGNLGGDVIQNSYHRITGIPPLKLKYDDGIQFGARMSTRLEYLLLNRYDDIELSMFGAATLSSSGLPNILRSGLSALFVTRSVAWDINCGYARRDRITAELSKVLGSAWFYAILGEIPISDQLALAAWMTQDQFGIKGEVHFGLNISWNKGGKLYSRMKDFTFP